MTNLRRRHFKPLVFSTRCVGRLQRRRQLLYFLCLVLVLACVTGVQKGRGEGIRVQQSLSKIYQHPVDLVEETAEILFEKINTGCYQLCSSLDFSFSVNVRLLSPCKSFSFQIC